MTRPLRGRPSGQLMNVNESKCSLGLVSSGCWRHVPASRNGTPTELHISHARDISQSSARGNGIDKVYSFEAQRCHGDASSDLPLEPLDREREQLKEEQANRQTGRPMKPNCRQAEPGLTSRDCIHSFGSDSHIPGGSNAPCQVWQRRLCGRHQTHRKHNEGSKPCEANHLRSESDRWPYISFRLRQHEQPKQAEAPNHALLLPLTCPQGSQRTGHVAGSPSSTNRPETIALMGILEKIVMLSQLFHTLAAPKSAQARFTLLTEGLGHQFRPDTMERMLSTFRIGTFNKLQHNIHMNSRRMQQGQAMQSAHFLSDENDWSTRASTKGETFQSPRAQGIEETRRKSR